MTAKYMLDTNTVSHALTGRNRSVLERIAGVATDNICVSVVTYAESTFGLSRLPEATALRRSSERFYAEITILPYDVRTAETYGKLRAALERSGRPLGPLDMLIAAHALSVGAILVSQDKAFRFVPNLDVEDWSAV